MALGKEPYKIAVVFLMVIMQIALITSGLFTPICCHSFSAKADIKQIECSCCQNSFININKHECPDCNEGCACKNRKKAGEQIPASFAKLFTGFEKISYAGANIIPFFGFRENDCFKNFNRSYTPQSNKLDILRTIVMLN